MEYFAIHLLKINAHRYFVSVILLCILFTSINFLWIKLPLTIVYRAIRHTVTADWRNVYARFRWTCAKIRADQLNVTPSKVAANRARLT